MWVTTLCPSAEVGLTILLVFFAMRFDHQYLGLIVSLSAAGHRLSIAIWVNNVRSRIPSSDGVKVGTGAVRVGLHLELKEVQMVMLKNDKLLFIVGIALVIAGVVIGWKPELTAAGFTMVLPGLHLCRHAGYRIYDK